MARPTHDIVATLGEYTAGDGVTRKRYQTCGKAFMNAAGRISLRLAVLPCDPSWSGWLSLYPVREDAPAPRQDPLPAPRGLPPTPAADGPDEDDEISF